MRKSSLWKTLGWYARLTCTINEYNNKNNNKNQERITKAFEKLLLSDFNYQITKIFLWYMFNNIAHFNLFKFSWFKQSINILRFMASTSKAFYFCFLLLPNLWKIARQFKMLTVLYFYRFIIIFSLTLQQVLLAIELNKVTNFSIPFAFENIYNKNSLWWENIGNRLSSSTLSIWYFSQGNFTNWKDTILYFEGIWR